MTIRIKNESDLAALRKQGVLGKNIELQVRNALNATRGSATTKSTPTSNASVTHLDFTARKNSISVERDKRKERDVFYTLPEYEKSPDPVVVLYRACVKRWGRFYDGGEAVWELVIANPRSFSFDIAFPRYRIAIEFDGFQYHSSKDAIKRDHSKTEQASRMGWLIFRVGKSRVINPSELDNFLDSVQSAMQHVTQGCAEVVMYPGTKKKKSFRSQLLNWKPEKLRIPPAFTASA
jgi:hypothetical protein